MAPAYLQKLQRCQRLIGWVLRGRTHVESQCVGALGDGHDAEGTVGNQDMCISSSVAGRTRSISRLEVSRMS